MEGKCGATAPATTTLCFNTIFRGYPTRLTNRLSVQCKRQTSSAPAPSVAWGRGACPTLSSRASAGF